jgi:hypothetical protein
MLKIYAKGMNKSNRKIRKFIFWKSAVDLKMVKVTRHITPCRLAIIHRRRKNFVAPKKTLLGLF